MAPATESPGVIIGGMGRPSMIVVLVLVTFNEPLGIGVAVFPMNVVAAADASEAVVEVPGGLLVSCLDEALVVAAPLDEGDRLVEIRAFVCSSVV